MSIMIPNVHCTIAFYINGLFFNNSSKFKSLHNFKLFSSDANNKFEILHLNVRSYYKKCDELLLNLNKLQNLDLIDLSECSLQEG